MTRTLQQGAVGVLLLAAIFVLSLTPSWAQESADASRKVLVRTQAIYPTLARSMNIHGIVKVEAQVLPNGTVKSIDVKGGHPLLTQSAVTAVGHWKFEPAPHETKEIIEIKFEQE